MKTRLLKSSALASLALLTLLGCASSTAQLAQAATPSVTPGVTPGTNGMIEGTPTGTAAGGLPTPTLGVGGGGSPGGAAPTPTQALAATPTPCPLGQVETTVTATSANSSGDETDIDPSVSCNPNAILIVTANANPRGRSPVYDPHPLGVYYHSGKWAIFHEDRVNWILGASYNVRVLPPSAYAFTVQATSANSSGPLTAIDGAVAERLINNNPYAILLVTPLWRSNGPLHPGVYDASPLGVSYRVGVVTMWYIGHQDNVHWVLGALYNVQVLNASANARVIGTSSSGSGASVFIVRCPYCDGNENARLFVTHRWDGGATNDTHAVGVIYTSQHLWALVHEDGASFVGTRYNLAAG
jgi:hypothetical protein